MGVFYSIIIGPNAFFNVIKKTHKQSKQNKENKKKLRLISEICLTHVSSFALFFPDAHNIKQTVSKTKLIKTTIKHVKHYISVRPQREITT